MASFWGLHPAASLPPLRTLTSCGSGLEHAHSSLYDRPCLCHRPSSPCPDCPRRYAYSTYHSGLAYHGGVRTPRLRWRFYLWPCCGVAASRCDAPDDLLSRDPIACLLCRPKLTPLPSTLLGAHNAGGHRQTPPYLGAAAGGRRVGPPFTGSVARSPISAPGAGVSSTPTLLSKPLT